MGRCKIRTYVLTMTQKQRNERLTSSSLSSGTGVEHFLAFMSG